MAGNDQFEGRTRARVGQGRRSAPGLGVIAALLGAGLLLLLVLAGSLDAPAAPAPAVADLPATPSPTPPGVTPTPAAPAIPSLVYLANGGGAILVFDQNGQPAYRLDGRDFALSADYGTLFVVGDGVVSAHDAGNGFELWRTPIANIRESRLGLPSPVIPRPDGRAVGVISEYLLPDGSNATYLTFHQINARTGAQLTEPFDLIGWNGSDAPFFSADGRRLVVPGDSDDVLLLDTRTGVRVGQLELDSPTIAIWPLPNTGSFVWVSAQAVDRAVSDDHGVDVTLLDAASLRQLDTLRIELPARHWPTLLGAVSADGLLALRLLEEPADAADLTLANLTNYLVVTDLRGDRPSPRRPLERQVSAMAFDPMSDALYVAYAPAAGAGAAVARLSGERFDPQPLLAMGGDEVVRLAVGPGSLVFVSPAPSDLLPGLPTARPLDQPPFNRSAPLRPSQPMPFVLPLTGTTTITISAEIGHGGERIFTVQGERERLSQNREVAWLSVPTMAGFDVVSIAAGGAVTSRARGVVAAITRAQAPPWLLIRRADSWALGDPAAGSETPLQLPADRPLQGCVAAPDGQRLACQSSPAALAIIAVADGSVRTIATQTAGTLDLRGGIPLLWTANGIYGYSLSSGSRLLWLVDPDAGDHAAAILLAIPEADRFALSSGAAAGDERAIYTLSGYRELRVRDLATGRETLLAQDLAPAGGMASLSPDGRRAAYARPAAQGGYDLIVVDLDSGEQLMRATGLAFVAYSWRWSQSGDRLLYRALEPAGSPERERIVVADIAPGRLLADLPLPGHTVAGVEFGADGMVAALIYEGMLADVVLLDADGRSQRLGISYPLGASRPTLLYVP